MFGKNKSFNIIRAVRLLGICLSVLLTGLLFSQVWRLSNEASENIVAAVEASVPDTVSQTTWQGIWLGYLALAICISALCITVKVLPLTLFSAPQRVAIFAIPISAMSLTPLLGYELPVISLLVVIVFTTLRVEKLRAR